MKVEIEIHEYSAEDGLQTVWLDDASIAVELSNNEVLISGNPAGLTSLASHLLTLAQTGVPDGHHFHYDPDYGLDADSESLILMRVNR